MEYQTICDAKVSDELKKQLENNDTVEIRFVVRDGTIQESVIMASGEGLHGFLTHMFYKLMNGSKYVDSDLLCDLCAISIAHAQEIIEKDKAGGMN